MAERISQVETIRSDLVAGFERDFGKYAGPGHAQHIDAVFHNIPRQLETTLDGSVKRFRFRGVVARKRDYISFDDDVARLAAMDDPLGFASDLPDRVIIDEIQHVPELFSTLKLTIEL